MEKYTIYNGEEIRQAGTAPTKDDVEVLLGPGDKVLYGIIKADKSKFKVKKGKIEKK